METMFPTDLVFIKVLNMSLTSVYVILFVVAVRFLLRKAPKAYSYGLWSVVLFRLVCPVSLQGVFSLIRIKPNPIADSIMHSEGPQMSPGIGLVDKTSRPVLPSQPPAGDVTGISPIRLWVSIARTIWLLGIALMLVYGVVSLIRIRSKLTGAVRHRDNIYLADHIDTPFVIGLIRPKICLPSDLSEKEQEFVILHELTHIKRLDHIAKVIAFLALVLHWFNPFVWLAFFLSVKDMEMSCDEKVISSMDAGSRVEYSQVLLNLSTGKRMVAAVPIAFGEGEAKSRLKNVLNYRKPEWWVVAVALVTVVAVVIGLAVNPRTGDKGLASTLLQYRTEYVGNAPKVGGIVTTLEYPANVEYCHFSLQTDTPPYSVTLYLNTDADTLRFYSEDINQGPFFKNAVIMLSLIRNADSVMFMLDDGTRTHAMEFTRSMAESFMGGNLWAYSESQEQFDGFLETLDSMEICLPESDG